MTKVETYLQIKERAAEYLRFYQQRINSIFYKYPKTEYDGHEFGFTKIGREEGFYDKDIQITQTVFSGKRIENTSCHCHPEYKLTYVLSLPSYLLEIEDAYEYQDAAKEEIERLITETKKEWDKIHP